jgi:hypothetical protein
MLFTALLSSLLGTLKLCRASWEASPRASWIADPSVQIVCPAPLPPLGSERYGYYGANYNRESLVYTDLVELCADQLQFYTSRDWDERVINMGASSFHNFGGRCINGKVQLVSKPDWEQSRQRAGVRLTNDYLRMVLLTFYHEFVNTWDYCSSKCYCLESWLKHVEEERRKGYPKLLSDLKRVGGHNPKKNAGLYRTPRQLSIEAVYSPHNAQCNGRCERWEDCKGSPSDSDCGGDRVCLAGNGNRKRPLGQSQATVAHCISVSKLLGKRDEEILPRDAWKCMCNETYVANACCWRKDGIVQEEMEIPTVAP